MLSSCRRNTTPASIPTVYDGREKGGTVRTIRFAHQMKKELREIPVGEIVLPGQPATERK